MRTSKEVIFNKYFSQETIEKLVFSKIIEDSKVLDSKFSLFGGIDKIMHTTLQSLDIKFGYFLEDVINEIIYSKEGVSALERKVKNNEGEVLEYDSHFKYDETEYILEIKKRNNHDSTKKVGQMKNLIEKYTLSNYENKIVILYFIDESYGRKNHNYYQKTWDENFIQEGIFSILYEEELFDKLPFLGQEDLEEFINIVEETSEKVSLSVRRLITNIGSNEEKKSEFLVKGLKFIEENYKGKRKIEAVERLKSFLDYDE